MPDLDIADRPLPRLDAVQEIPHMREVHVVRALFAGRIGPVYWFLIRSRLLFRYYFKELAVDIQGPFSAMEHNAVALPLDRVAIALAILVCANKPRILVSDHQRIGRLAIVYQV